MTNKNTEIHLPLLQIQQDVSYHMSFNYYYYYATRRFGISKKSHCTNCVVLQSNIIIEEITYICSNKKYYYRGNNLYMI